MSRTNSREHRVLSEMFPEAFTRVSPLKVGVTHDLVKLIDDGSLELLKERVAKHLRHWCMTDIYLSRMKEGRERIDLEGRPCGVVTAEQAELGKKQLKNVKARIKKEKAQAKERRRLRVEAYERAGLMADEGVGLRGRSDEPTP